MFKIIQAQWLAPGVKRLRVYAPLVARHRQPGQFVIVRARETGERIPLTVADADPTAGTIDLIIKVVGKTTAVICAKSKGEAIADVAGPLGRPTELCSDGRAVVIGGGVGTAVIYPLVRALRREGNHVTAIIGGRTREFLLLEEELGNICDTVFSCTDDGSYGFNGTVADRLLGLILETNGLIDAVYAAGPVPMMRAIAEVTRPGGFRTIVSLNPIMVDGTGMCGGCRVTVGGETKYACVDGPEFDAHQVDFDSLMNRLTAYRAEERMALEAYERQCALEVCRH
jgi:ferredoxin--NADP+ reductase